MRSSEKALLAALSVMICAALLSACMIEPMLRGEYASCQDAKNRETLAGSIDFLVLGASHAAHSLIPRALDERLGVHSYNLSGAGLTVYGRAALLEKEMARNPIRDIVLEVSFNTLMKTPETDRYEGDLYLLTRMDSWAERLSFIRRHIPFSDWDTVYSMLLRFAGKYWTARLTGKSTRNVMYADKGYEHGESADMTAYAGEIEPLITDIRPESAEEFRLLIDAAKSGGANVTVVVVPVSLARIRAYPGWDGIMGEISALCAEQGARLYDFNLYKSRQSLFPEERAFHDPIHMSDFGAEAFTREFARLYPEMKTGLTDELFYGSYDEMLSSFQDADEKNQSARTGCEEICG